MGEIACDRFAAARAATHTARGRIKGLCRLRVPEDRTVKGLWTLHTIRRGQPIDAGQMFGTLVRELGKSDLTEIRRQSESWARDAVRAVLAGQSSDALSAFDQRGLVARSSDAAASLKILTGHWMADDLPMQKS